MFYGKNPASLPLSSNEQDRYELKGNLSISKCYLLIVFLKVDSLGSRNQYLEWISPNLRALLILRKVKRSNKIIREKLWLFSMNIYLMLHFRNTPFFLRCFIDSCKSFSLHIEQILTQFLFHHVYRAVVRSENPGVPVLFDGHNLPTLVEIGLTDLPKSGGAMTPPAPPWTTP